MSGFEMLFQFVDFLLNISSCHLNCGLCRTLFSLATSKDLFLTLTLNHRIWACISVRFSSLGFTDLWICKVRYSACLKHFWSLFLSVLCLCQHLSLLLLGFQWHGCWIFLYSPESYWGCAHFLRDLFMCVCLSVSTCVYMGVQAETGRGSGILLDHFLLIPLVWGLSLNLGLMFSPLGW